MKNKQNFGLKLGLLAFILFTIILWGLFWLVTTPVQSVTLMLAYAAGLSMIFLPCTLPLVFVIIPLSLGKGKKKGLIMSLMFGLGLTMTLTFYGLSVAFLGRWLGLDQTSRFMFQIAGVAAYLFGLTQLKLIHFEVPEITGIPIWVQRKSDYFKSFLMGLLLGNAGVGCPNPAFYVLLAFIASTGSYVYGGALGAVHGLGRATPLIFLTILAILGVNSTTWIAQRQQTVLKMTGWGLLAVGVFIFSVGFFGMDWWERSFIHVGWNSFVEAYVPNLAETEIAAEVFGITVKPSTLEKYLPRLPWIFMTVMLIFPYFWYRFQSRVERSKKI